jgi:hypothetical protein
VLNRAGALGRTTNPALNSDALETGKEAALDQSRRLLEMDATSA